MRFLHAFIFSCVLGLSAQTLAQALPPAVQPGNGLNQPFYFDVSGTAEIRVKPDRVTMTLGVHERSQNLNEANRKMSEVINAIIDFCKQNHIDESNIQTAYIQIHPQYRYSEIGLSQQQYFIVQQSLTVTLEDVDQYNQVIYGLLNLGVNTVENVHFWSSEAAAYRNQARLNAVEAAKEKAVLLAGAAGIRLGPIVNVAEDSNLMGVYRSPHAMSANSSLAMHQEGFGGSGADNAVSVAGMVSVHATVRLTYQVLPPEN